MKRCIVAVSILMISFLVSACNGKGDSSALFSVGGMVRGLTGTLVLQNNGGDDLTVTGNGPFFFPTAMDPGSSYAVTVGTDPSGQTCLVSNGTGTILISSATNVSVHCFEGGTLDLTFNAPKGFAVHNNAAGGHDFGNAVAVDSQGRIISAGSSTNSAGNMDMVIWRFNSDGTLDTSFNNTGVVVYDNASGGSGDDFGKGIAVDYLDRILVTGSTTSGGNADMAVWRFKTDGTLDTTLNGTGMIVHNNAAGGGGDDSGNAIVVDAQRRIVVAGSSTNSAGNLDMAVWRFNPNGPIDTEFSVNGIFTHNGAAGVATSDDVGNAVVIDSSGRILVAGSSINSTGNSDMVVWRFKADGTGLDNSFSTDGIVAHNGAAGGTGDDFGNGIAIDSDSKVLVVGSSTNSLGNKDMVVWRYKADGVFDPAFGGDGIVVNNGAAGLDGDDSGNAVAVDSQGRILLAGSSTNIAGNADMVVWRFSAAGIIDTTFGTNGVLTHDSAAEGSGADAGRAVAIDSQSRILVAGTSTNSAGNSDMVIWRIFP